MKFPGLLRKVLIGLYKSVRRFPVTIGFATAAAIVAIIISHLKLQDSRDTIDLLVRIAMTLALGIPLSLSIGLFFERKGSCKRVILVAAYLAGILVLALYYFFLFTGFDMVSTTRFIAVNLVLYLAFLFIPYFYRRENFELYIINIVIRFFVTILYSVVLFLGLAAIVFTIDKLLSVPITRYIYYSDIWFSVAGIFAPCYFLAGLPHKTQELEAANYPKLLRILLLYIVMPIISIYTVILYIYFFKVIVTQEWPIGLVSHLVLWYSVIGTGVIFLIFPLRMENKWARIFISWFSKLVLLLILMMFFSMGIRLKAYGFTENRYFVLVLGLWVFGVMVYLNLSKAKRNIIMPVSLAAVAFLSVFGPWSSYNVSKFSQNSRLQHLLSKYDMIKDSSIVKPSDTVSDKDKIEMTGILSYFDSSHKLSEVKYLPKNFSIDKMEKVFGFSQMYSREDPSKNNYFENIHFIYRASHDNGIALDIKDFDYMVDFNLYDGKATETIDKLDISYDIQSTQLSIVSGGIEIYSTTLSEYIQKLYKKYGNKDVYDIDMVFTDEKEKIIVKCIFSEISASFSQSKLGVDHISFFALIKEK